MRSSTAGYTTRVKNNTKKIEYYKKLLKAVHRTLTTESMWFLSAIMLSPFLPLPP